MTTGYLAFKPYWEAWKYDTIRPADSKSAALCNGLKTMFKALVDGNTPADPDLAEPYKFLIDIKPHWTHAVTHSANWDNSTRRVVLYRGVTNENAIRLRCALQHAKPAFEKYGSPVCYTVDINVARGEAGRGLHPGLCYQLAVPLESILFFDHEQHPVEGNNQLEKEVICWHHNPIPISMGDVVCLSVSNRLPRPHSKSKMATIQARIKELAELEEKCNRAND